MPCESENVQELPLECTSVTGELGQAGLCTARGLGGKTCLIEIKCQRKMDAEEEVRSYDMQMLIGSGDRYHLHKSQYG